MISKVSDGLESLNNGVIHFQDRRLHTLSVVCNAVFNHYNTLLSHSYEPLTGLESNRFKQDLDQIALLQQYSTGFWISSQNKFNHHM